MENGHLDPSVREFRSFINRHPQLAASIRKSGRPWQEYYEKWALLGENDPFWEQYQDDSQQSKKTQESGKQTEIIEQLKKLSDNVDVDKIQHHAHQLSGTISTVQELISQFKDKGEQSTSNEINYNSWFKD